LPVVQPVAAVAQELRLLPEERWRPVPRGARWKVLLGDLFRRHASGPALPGSGNRNRRPEWLAAYAIVRVLRERWHCAPASRTQRNCYPRAPAGILGRMARQLPEAPRPWQHRLPAGRG